MSKQRRYSAEFKLDAVSRMEHCETITGLGGDRRHDTYPQNCCNRYAVPLSPGLWLFSPTNHIAKPRGAEGL
jgi:hypothetical protein